MAEVEPAVVHMACPWEGCGEIVDCPIPVSAVVQDGTLRVWIPATGACFTQPLWDHQLERHGPSVD